MSLGTVGADLILMSPDLPRKKEDVADVAGCGQLLQGRPAAGALGLPPRPHSPSPAGKRKQMFSQQTGRETRRSPGPGNWKETPHRHGGHSRSAARGVF